MIRIPPIILLTVVGVIAAVSLMRVKFSASLYEMLPADLPEVQGMDRLNRYFSRDGQLIVTVKASDAYVADEALESLTTRLREEPGLISQVFRELSLTELVTEGGSLLSWLWLNSPPDELEVLLDRLKAGSSAEAIAGSMDAIQSGFFDQNVVVSSYDPLGFSKLGSSFGVSGEDGETSNPDPMASEDGTFQIVYVEGSGVDFSDYRAAKVWLDQVKVVVADWEEKWLESQPPGTKVTIGLTGTPAFMAEVGSEMERDMTISVVATMLLISLLFWVMHRKTKPLSWLVASMMIILIITVNLGGLLFGDLSVMSVGFAAILMGLAVDYGIVLYREAMDTGQDAKGLRQSVGPGIIWAAATTAVVFLSLNLSSLPGLSEMGNLVAIGVAVGALVMLFFFGPVAVQFNQDAVAQKGIQLTGGGVTRKASGWLAILVPVVAILSMFFREMPGLEANFHPFRIRESPSMKAWQELQHELLGRENAVPTIVTAKTLEELQQNLEKASGRIEAACEEGVLQEYILPAGLIPNPDHQKANLEAVRNVMAERERLIREIDEAGFSEDGQKLTQSVFEAWADYIQQLDSSGYAKPSGQLAEWSIDRLFSEKGGNFAALATVKPTDPTDRTWVNEICTPDTVVASLGSLGTALNERIGADLLRVFLPMMALLTVMLAAVYRSWRDLVLSLFCLVFSAAVIVILTVWTPLSWNSFNVCGLPLLFGTGLDFSIHMIFALRREKGDVAAARHGIGKALVFCGTSSAIGFGSLATASAYGLASLGIVCAIGILVNMVVAVWLLPRWYRTIYRMEPVG